MPATKTPSMHHLQVRNVTTSMAGLKNGQIRKNLTQNGEFKSYSKGTHKKKKSSDNTLTHGQPVLEATVQHQASAGVSFFEPLVHLDRDLNPKSQALEPGAVTTGSPRRSG